MTPTAVLDARWEAAVAIEPPPAACPRRHVTCRRCDAWTAWLTRMALILDGTVTAIPVAHQLPLELGDVA